MRRLRLAAASRVCQPRKSRWSGRAACQSARSVVPTGRRASPRRNTRATPTNRRGSHAIPFAGNVGVRSFEEPAHLTNGAHRNELDPVLILKRLDLLPGLEPERLADLAGNDHLELRRNGNHRHTQLTIDEIYV